jgi:hypothetical protein
MKKLVSFLLGINLLFAVNDYLSKPSKNLFRILYSIDTVYPESLDSHIESDSHNVFKYSGHFRVIFGKEYNNSIITNNLADKILNISNYVWQKEIVNFGFKPPRNSDYYYIDIYIANKNSYNPETGYISIPSYYAGYASFYSNGTPYFIINPDNGDDINEVTIAHEFFHTIQYAYDLDSVSQDIWNKNVWFLEATAVMMEDEVYDNVNDYFNYLPYYLNYTNYPLEYYNRGIEYGKVLFAKFIKEKFGLEKIKKIFEDYETNETILDDLQKEFDFNKLMLDFGKCLANLHTCFEEGENYPNIKYYSENNLANIGKYGILFLNEGNQSYLASVNNQYLQEDFNGNFNKKININENGLIVINKQNDTMNSNILLKNNFSGIKIKKGWNLISNIFANELNLTTMEGIIFWVYRNGKYQAYSNLTTFKKAIHNINVEMENDFINKNEGFWVYSNKDVNVGINKIELADNNITLQNGWQIVGFSSAFEPKYINAKIIWEYDKNWSYYSEYEDLNYSKIKIMSPLKGYFIKN